VKVSEFRDFDDRANLTLDSGILFGSGMSGAFYFTRSIRYTGAEPYREPVDCPIGCNKWTAGGFHKIIDARLQEPQFFDRYGLVEGIRKAITDEISADKAGEIGFPISILELNGPSSTWSMPGVCVSSKNGDRKQSKNQKK
jgi:hypothetical protein